MKGVPFLCPHPESVNHSTLFLSVENNARRLAVTSIQCCNKNRFGQTNLSQCLFELSLFVINHPPFQGLGPEEGHRGWILSSCYLAQTAAATRSLEQESVDLENRDHIQCRQRASAPYASDEKMICPGLIPQIRKLTKNRLNKNELTVISVVRLPLVGHVQICLIPLGRSLLPLHTLI